MLDINQTSEWTVENYWSMGSGLGSSDWSCYSRWYGADSNTPLTLTEGVFKPLFVMNHFRDAAIAATATNDNTKLAARPSGSAGRLPARSPTSLLWTTTTWEIRPRRLPC